MRILVWNAAMAVHRKLPVLIDAYHPDIAVIPECACPAVLERKSAVGRHTSMIWTGRNPVYRDWIAGTPTIFAGDFNHNVRWDRPRGRRNHSATLASAEGAGLTSAYHHWFGEAQGAESRPTIYWRDRTETGLSYHIDYAFIPRAWLSSVTAVTLGGYDEWVASGLSDHVPLVLDFAAPITS